MKIRSRDLIRPGLPVIGALLLSGCNSQSSSPPSSSSPPAPQAQTRSSAAAGATTPAAAPADVTAAPQRKPPAGMGNAIGRVLFDGKGASGIEVELCEEIGLVGGCSGKTYQGKTDRDGFYIIDKVKPGDYGLAVRVFDSNKFLYPTAGILSAAKFKVEKDQSLSVRTVNLWKTNLQIDSPKNGGTVNTGKPKLSWKAYPHAANYKVTVRTKEGTGSLPEMETSATSTIPEKPLLNGEYQWKVEASNAEGTKIAETADDATFKVAGQAGSNTVELVNPRQDTTVGAAGLTLQWKAHPQAQEYRVYLKGLSAKDPLLSFASMKGTSYKPATPLPADQYYWSVDAYKDGDKIAGSSLQHFTAK